MTASMTASPDEEHLDAEQADSEGSLIFCNGCQDYYQGVCPHHLVVWLNYGTGELAESNR